MRESIGGTFLINIMVIFLILYNALLAIAVNYAIAFRVKNQIINLLEQYEGCANVSVSCAGQGPTSNCVSNYVQSVGYYRAASPTEKGYEVEAKQVEGRGTYYVVSTKIKFDFPWFGDILDIKINGETKVIYGKNEGKAQCDNI